MPSIRHLAGAVVLAAFFGSGCSGVSSMQQEPAVKGCACYPMCDGMPVEKKAVTSGGISAMPMAPPYATGLLPPTGDSMAGSTCESCGGGYMAGSCACCGAMMKKG